MLLTSLVAADTLANGPISSENAGKQETGFGDLMADALLDASKADIAFVAAVSLKPGTIPAGPITAEQMAGLLQSPGEVWAVSKLTGGQVKAALENSLSRLPGNSTGFLQVAGIQVTYDPDGPRNERVKSVKVGSAPLSADKTYRVAMPLSLAKGGSGYFVVFSASMIDGQPSKQPILKAATDMVFGMRSVTYEGKGRLIAE
jgi:2',3'-cyclic-nucleotide 2'-phosphodiesterase (5'-nucleotidase family)